jgi:formylmethanofuran dehydrogenase subunit E
MALLDPITHGKMNDCDIRIEKNIMEQDHKKKKAADRLRAKLAKKQEEKQAQADREYTEWLNRHRVVLAEQRRGRDEQRRLIAERQ